MAFSAFELRQLRVLHRAETCLFLFLPVSPCLLEVVCLFVSFFLSLLICKVNCLEPENGFVGVKSCFPWPIFSNELEWRMQKLVAHNVPVPTGIEILRFAYKLGKASITGPGVFGAAICCRQWALQFSAVSLLPALFISDYLPVPGSF